MSEISKMKTNYSFRKTITPHTESRGKNTVSCSHVGTLHSAVNSVCKSPYRGNIALWFTHCFW